MPETVLGIPDPYLYVKGPNGISQRFPLKKPLHALGRDVGQVDLVVDESWTVMSNYHAELIRREDGIYWIHDGNTRTGKTSTNGLLYQHRRITNREGHPLENGHEITIGQNPETQVKLTYLDPSVVDISQGNVTQLTQKGVGLDRGTVVLGREESETGRGLLLDSPMVSRCHAVVEQSGAAYVLSDRSTNGTFVDGKKVSGSVPLRDGAIIKIGPFTLVRRGDRLDLQDLGDSIRLDAENLRLNGSNPVWFWEGDKYGRLAGNPTTAGGLGRLSTFPRIQDVTLPIEPGQLIALVGGSGAGKSSLMKALLGIEALQGGQVRLNGSDLRENFNQYRHQIGYVPQDDILHGDLTVLEALSYIARLRLPSDGDIARRVGKVLKDVDMQHKEDDPIRTLSGGQRKRVSIAAELLADPKLFFLDEPTSGLDPGLDKKMMQLLQGLAREGRTVVLVTHATANIDLCDRVTFLGREGRLCYFGPPQGVFDFFEVTSGDFADVYIRLEPGTQDETEQAVASWRDQFNASQFYRNYVVASFTQETGFNSTIKPKSARAAPSAMGGAQSSELEKVQRSPFRQWQTLCQRYLALISRDKAALVYKLLTAPAAIILTLWVINDVNCLVGSSDPDPAASGTAIKILFMLTCASLWVGTSGSIGEIVKENAIYIRERLVNLGLFPYLWSKWSVLGGLAVIQSATMVIALLLVNSPESELFPWLLGVFLTTTLTLASSVSLGLLVSTICRSAAAATSFLPLIMLPQIIGAGVLFKMEGVAEYFSWLMVGRWSIGAYGILADVNSLLPETLPDGTVTELPVIYDPTWENLGWNWGALVIHAGIYALITAIVKKRTDVI
ncbi:MAG: ATP-binding cassette domain-containing protein [Cyanophyceae cyanobacterium]